MQLWGWGELKTAHRWRALRVIFADESEVVYGAAQILVRTLPAPFGSFWYVPRGPVCMAGHQQDVYDALAQYAREHAKGVVLCIEPDDSVSVPVGRWRRSRTTVLLPRTIILDLTKSADELQQAMTKKTRQYIRKSSGEVVVFRKITTENELEQCLSLYHETADRAGFALHNDQYYRDVHAYMGESSVVFAAFVDESPVAFVWLAVSAATAFELYGGMNANGQSLRANYGLKWHAITQCQQWGITRYDMNGLLNDGVSTFKQGFAAHEDELIGSYDYPLSPLYAAWTHALPLTKRTIQKIKSLRK